MKKQTLIFSIGLLAFATVGFAQDKMEVKDANNNLLMQVNDEGTTGSVTLPDVVSDPSSVTNKLYNKGGALYFNGNAMGGSGGGLVYGWAANLSSQNTSTANTFFFGAGTGEQTSGNGVTWDDPNNRFVVQQAGVYKIEFHWIVEQSPSLFNAPFVTFRTTSNIFSYNYDTFSGVRSGTATYVVTLSANHTIQGSVEFSGNATARLLQCSMMVTKLD